jgi:hypothetical protein
MNPIKKKALMIQAIVGAILITILLLPFQAATPYATYTWMIFIPIVIFFSLGANPKILPAMFLSFVCGTGWGAVFFFATDVFSSLPMNLLFAILTTIIIFFILAIHPILLGKTPLAIVPCVLIGFIESLYTYLIVPANAPIISIPQLIFFFGYGVVLGGILAIVNNLLCTKLLGKDWLTHMQS